MKKQIYLIDPSHESALGMGSDTMPLQLGLIGAYCLKEHGDKVDVQIFKFVHEFAKAVKKQPPFIAAASNYQWNIDLGYKLISIIKEQYPDIITVFGGPNYPVESEKQAEWLRRHPNADFYIFRDGELPFSRLVGAVLKNKNLTEIKKAKLPSCHALINGEPYFGETEPRPKDLTVIPSPYASGLMDKFFEKRLIPPIQTNRGCPFNCTYCTEGEKYYNEVCRADFERKKKDIDYIISKVKNTTTLRITDSNFGMFPEDVEFCKYLSKIQGKTGYPDYLCCSTGKNQKARVLECNKLLRGVMRVTASVQSLNKEVLKAAKRINISVDDIMAMSDQVSDSDTYSYSEIILGLPADSLAGQIESMDGLMRAGINNITQHQLSIVHGAEVSTRESREKYKIKSMFRPIQRCIGIYSFQDKIFPSVEIEEISVATNTLSFEDYVESRKLYLSVGLFYNDRIFGEIHALLRLLRLPTWEWVKLIHDNIDKAPAEIKSLYDGFEHDTKHELWDNPEDLTRDVIANIDKYTSGKAGGNLIYKFRSQAIIRHFPELHKTAFYYLRKYLDNKGVECEDVVKDIEKFSKYQKADIFNLDFTADDTFSYDIVKMIKNPSLARGKGSLKDIHCPVRIFISHTDKQKELISRQLESYGKSPGGLTMLLSRFPVKRFYRNVSVISN